MRLGLHMAEYPGLSAQGGLCTYTCTLAAALAAAGHEVVLLAKRGAALPAIPAAIRVRTLDPAPLSGPLQSFYHRFAPGAAMLRSWSLSAFRAFREEGVEVAQVPDYNGEALLFGPRRFRLAVRFHTPAFLVDRLNGVRRTFERRLWYRMEGRAIRGADGLTSSSEALRREVCARYRIDPRRVRVIRNPVDTVTFSPALARAPGGPPRVLFVGRLERRKGAGALVGLARALLRDRRDAILTLAGGTAGEEGGRLRAAITEAAGPGRDRLEWLGERPRAELPAIFRSADCFVIPSLFDNSPNTLFEAQATGLACVGADVGGVNEMINSGRDGLLYDPAVSGAFEAAVCGLLEDPSRRAELGRAARARVTDRHSPELIARETAGFYEGLLK